MRKEKKYYWPNGKLKHIIPYKNGKLHGIEKSYYRNGNPSYEMLFTNGKKCGIEKRYYRNGDIMFEISFKNNIRYGITKFYSYRLKLVKVKTYYHNNFIHGIKLGLK